MNLIKDANDPRFEELSEMWGPAVRSEDKMERNAAVAIAWLMESVRAVLTAKDVAYRERNRFVLFLTRCFPSHRCKHPESDASWERDWMNIICVHGPQGQMTWHIHDSELPAFEHLPLGESHWDGHTTEEKYVRLYRCDMSSPEIAALRREVERLQTNEVVIADERFDMERRLTARTEKAESTYRSQEMALANLRTRIAELEKVAIEAKMAVIGYPRYEMRPLREALVALAEKKRQVKTLEEYMLKGVEFRDELQAEVKRLEDNEDALADIQVALADQNDALKARLSNLEKIARDILANGYDQGRRITLRAALAALPPKEGE